MDGGVLQLISSLGVGGAERLLVDYIAQTAGAARAQTVVVMNEGECPALRRDLVATGRAVHFLGRRRGAPTPWTLVSILKIIDADAIRIVHSHNSGSRTWSCLAKAARPSLKLAHTLHTTGVVCASKLPPFYKALIDGTVAISPAVEEGCVAARLSGVRMIENGVALRRFSPRAEGEPHDGLRILTVGRLSREKGQDLLLRALIACGETGLAFECRLIGDPAPNDGGYAAELRASLAHPHLVGRVWVEGGRTDIPDILPWADMFVSPSRAEGFGLALVEAMAGGLAVIATDVGGPGRILRDHPEAGILAAPQSPQALAEAILKLGAAPDERRRLAAEGPRAAAHYSIERMAARYEDFYAGL